MGENSPILPEDGKHYGSNNTDGDENTFEDDNHFDVPRESMAIEFLHENSPILPEDGKHNGNNNTDGDENTFEDDNHFEDPQEGMAIESPHENSQILPEDGPYNGSNNTDGDENNHEDDNHYEVLQEEAGAHATPPVFDDDSNCSDEFSTHSSGEEFWQEYRANADTDGNCDMYHPPDYFSSMDGVDSNVVMEQNIQVHYRWTLHSCCTCNRQYNKAYGPNIPQDDFCSSLCFQKYGYFDASHCSKCHIPVELCTCKIETTHGKVPNVYDLFVQTVKHNIPLDLPSKQHADYLADRWNNLSTKKRCFFENRAKSFST